MKKTYINPEMNISVFSKENIVTSSGDVKIKAATYMQNNAATIFGNNYSANKTATIVF